MKQKYSHLMQVFIASIFSLSMTMVLPACKSENKPAAAATADKDETGMPADLSAMIKEEIEGSDTKYVRQLNAAGGVEIEGFMRDNKKTGQWIQYGDDGDIGLINNYVDGKLEGVAMRMIYRNQVDLKSNYHNGFLNGPWIQYKFGKKIEERNYKNGKLEGSIKIYDERTFKLKQEAEYKDGLQDGFFRYYDENGNVTLEYEYKKGEKVGGGMKTQ